MTILQAIILGIVEGVTEFLPISSTGHLILTGKLLGITDSNFLKSFEIAIQFGAILSVVVLYFKKIFSSKELWKKVFSAFLPTAVIGFLLYKILKDYLLSNALLVVWALAIGGVLLIVFELCLARLARRATPEGRHSLQATAEGHKQRTIVDEGHMSHKKAFLLGIFQSLAIIPGVSRSGATIIGGLLMGINRQAVVEFSFLLAVPTMATATAYDLYKSAGSFSFGEFHILAIGFVVSFIVALLSIKWLLYFIKNHTFIWFGVYRIVVALIFWFLVVG